MARTVRESGRSLLPLLDLVEQFDRLYGEKKRDRNVLDFNDLEHMALEILWEVSDGEDQSRRPSAVADELSRQYEEILVDEYQDSNSVQEMLVAGISRERFGAPNVFMVGDVKQSIYRFRLARPELFMEKYESYGPAAPYRKIELHQNFRSRPSVLDSVNQVFFQIMTRALGGIRYTEETALHAGAAFQEIPEDMEGERPGRTELLLLDVREALIRGIDEEYVDYQYCGCGATR